LRRGANQRVRVDACGEGQGPQRGGRIEHSQGPSCVGAHQDVRILRETGAQDGSRSVLSLATQGEAGVCTHEGIRVRQPRTERCLQSMIDDSSGHLRGGNRQRALTPAKGRQQHLDRCVLGAGAKSSDDCGAHTLVALSAEVCAKWLENTQVPKRAGCVSP
jgi:hypothetical protein